MTYDAGAAIACGDHQTFFTRLSSADYVMPAHLSETPDLINVDVPWLKVI
jgi:hypothetical protein